MSQISKWKDFQGDYEPLRVLEAGAVNITIFQFRFCTCNFYVLLEAILTETRETVSLHIWLEWQVAVGEKNVHVIKLDC